MSTLTYTDPALVADVQVRSVQGRRNADGYGPKISTRFLINYAGRWRRVYVMQYGNSGSAYVIVNGDDVFIDSHTEHMLGEWL